MNIPNSQEKQRKNLMKKIIKTTLILVTLTTSIFGVDQDCHKHYNKAQKLLEKVDRSHSDISASYIATIANAEINMYQACISKKRIDRYDANLKMIDETSKSYYKRASEIGKTLADKYNNYNNYNTLQKPHSNITHSGQE